MEERFCVFFFWPLISALHLFRDGKQRYTWCNVSIFTSRQISFMIQKVWRERALIKQTVASLHFSFYGREYLCLRLLTARRRPQTLKRIRVHVSKSIKASWNIHGYKQTHGAVSEYSASNDLPWKRTKSHQEHGEANPGEARGGKLLFKTYIIAKVDDIKNQLLHHPGKDWFILCFFLLRSELLDKWDISKDWTDHIGSSSIFMQI